MKGDCGRWKPWEDRLSKPRREINKKCLIYVGIKLIFEALQKSQNLFHAILKAWNASKIICSWRTVLFRILKVFWLAFFYFNFFCLINRLIRKKCELQFVFSCFSDDHVNKRKLLSDGKNNNIRNHKNNLKIIWWSQFAKVIYF